MRPLYRYAIHCGALIAILLAGTGDVAADLITFDAYSPQNLIEDSISYSGLNFRSNGSQYVWDVNPGATNGTPVLINGYGETSNVVITATNGDAFFLNSFDLGLTWLSQLTDTVHVIYNGSDGSITFDDIILDQHFVNIQLNLPALSAVIISGPHLGGYIALDNIDFHSAVPEPSPSCLVGFGGIGLAVSGIRRRRFLTAGYKAATA